MKTDTSPLSLHDFADTSSLQDYVFICQNFCVFAKKAVSLHHNL
jgi:hypothetical protein